MRSLTYTHLRQNLAATMDEVIDNHDPVIVTRGERAVVVMSMEDFNSWQETAYLLGTPANARRLLNSMATLDAGQGQERTLSE